LPSAPSQLSNRPRGHSPGPSLLEGIEMARGVTKDVPTGVWRKLAVGNGRRWTNRVHIRPDDAGEFTVAVETGTAPLIRATYGRECSQSATARGEFPGPFLVPADRPNPGLSDGPRRASSTFPV